MSVTLYQGDCLHELGRIPDASVDACVTDPPYELNFMGREWDRSGIANNVALWREVYRVLKPGGHLLAFGGTRTHHRMVCAIEDAGFEIRDTLQWLYSQGFPKSQNATKVLQSGLKACQCHKTMIQYPYEDLHHVRQSVGAEESVSGGAQPNMRPGLCGGTYQPIAGGADESTTPHSNVPTVSTGVHAGAARHAGAEVLLTQLPGEGEHSTPNAVCSERQGQTTARQGAKRRGQSRLEGRHDLLSQARQLQADQICAVPGGPAEHGPQGRLCNGASANHGAHGGAAFDAHRSSTPRRPQSPEQYPDELGTLAGQSDAQDRGGWPLCERCGLPTIPDGLGSALKPAHEPIVLARKPLGENTIAANVLAHKTGALNIDASRVPTAPADAEAMARCNTPGSGRFIPSPKTESTIGRQYPSAPLDTSAGRWPPNVLLCHAVGCVPTGTRRVKGTAPMGRPSQGGPTTGNDLFKKRHYSTPIDRAPDGTETIPAWRCVPGCPVAVLDGQSGERESRPGSTKATGKTTWFGDGDNPYDSTARYPGDTGGASRFFPTFAYEAADFAPFRYCAKASRSERTHGGRIPNAHPTVKPRALMAWLITLVTPPGGVVLDPFMGSGTTAVCAVAGGWDFIGCEQDEGSFLTAVERIAHTVQQIRPAQLPLEAAS